NPESFSGVRIQAAPKREVYDVLSATISSADTDSDSPPVRGFMLDPQSRRSYEQPDSLIISTFDATEELTAVAALTALLEGYATALTDRITRPASPNHVTMNGTTGYELTSPDGIERSTFERAIIGDPQIGIRRIVLDDEDSYIQAPHIPYIEPVRVKTVREVLDLFGCTITSVKMVDVLDTKIHGIEIRFQHTSDTDTPELPGPTEPTSPTLPVKRRALPAEPSDPSRIIKAEVHSTETVPPVLTRVDMSKRILKHLASGESFDTFLESAPEEVRDILQTIYVGLQEQFRTVDDQLRSQLP